jgi:hypothetical protein
MLGGLPIVKVNHPTHHGEESFMQKTSRWKDLEERKRCHIEGLDVNLQAKKWTMPLPLPRETNHQI